MIVLKTYLRLLKRHLHIIIIYFLIFFLISVILTPRGNEAPQNVQGEAIDVYFHVNDYDKSPASEALISFLERYFIRRDIPNGEEEEAVEDAIMIGSISAAITIREDFGRNIANGHEALLYALDPRDPGAQWLKAKCEVFLRLAYALTDSDGQLDIPALEDVLKTQASFEFPEAKPASSALALWFKNYYLYLSFILLSVIMQIFAQLLLPFKAGNVKNRSLVSAYSHLRCQAELIAGLILTAVLVLVLFVSASFLLVGTQKLGNVPLLPQYLLNALIFTFVCLAMSYLLIAIVPNRSAAYAGATVIPLGLSFISGVMVPQDYLSKLPLTISKAFPIYYYVRVIEDRPNLSFNLGIQLAFALLYILLALVISSARKKETVAF